MVVIVLVINGLLELQDAVSKGGHGAPLQEVVNACHKEHPLGLLILGVVSNISSLKVRNRMVPPGIVAQST